MTTRPSASSSDHVYELYAIRYATREAMRASHFMGGDSHDGPMPMDYFIWVARSPKHVVIIDLGFTEAAADRRRRKMLCNPIEGLKQIGIDPEAVEHAIITHLHYDHCGNFDLLPAARFHVQEAEMHFAAGRHMKYRYFSSGYETEDIVQAVRLNFAGRIVQHNGEADVLPGIRVVPLPGHSPGEQAVVVNTQRGRVVIASDAAHFYENVLRRKPYPACHHVAQMLESFDLLMELGGDDIARIIPGHDPLVMQLYPPASSELEGSVARLDMEPAPMSHGKPRKYS